MPKAEWGTKRVCPVTGKRFYDLNRIPIISPYTGEVVTLETARPGRVLVAQKADPKSVHKDDEVHLEDDDLEDEAGDELDSDLLDDDDDDVSLDDIADVPSDSDEG